MATRGRSKTRLTARLDRRSRLSTRWEHSKRRQWSRPIARNAAVTVRRPGARSVPTTSTRACDQTRREKHGANGASSASMTGGRVGIVSPPGRAVTSVPCYAAGRQMAKVKLRMWLGEELKPGPGMVGHAKEHGGGAKVGAAPGGRFREREA